MTKTLAPQEFQPPASVYVLANATVPTAVLTDQTLAAFRQPSANVLLRADITIETGRVSAISPAAEPQNTAANVFDLDGGMILPCLIDMHTHLDKGHIWPRQPNPDGSFQGALHATETDRSARWSAQDVRRRMDFSLRAAHAHGTNLIRTHLDTLIPQDEISWPVFEEMRQTWRGRIDLQAASIFGVDSLDDERFLPRIADRVAAAGGVLGAVTYMIPDLERRLDALFQAASARGLDLDFHVDETSDCGAHSLRMIAQAALRNRFEGRVICGHCCSLARQSDDEIDATLDLVAQAGLGVVSLPLCNMYLQDRTPGRTPRWRGVTLLHEMKARGVPVAIASDNTRDPFYAYGDLDMVEVLTQATRILHLDHPIADWVTAVTTTPADLLRRPDHGRIDAGLPADLILFQARNWSEFFARPSAPRKVLRAGASIDQTLPDFRELDDLMKGDT